MKYTKSYGISLVLVLCSALLPAQMENDKCQTLFPHIENWYEINADKEQIEMLISVEQPKDQPFRFAYPVALDLNPDNAGFIVKNENEAVWVMPLASKGALSLNVILEPFQLPPGAWVSVYDADHNVVRGGFTGESAADRSSLSILPVPGEKLILECHFPGGSIPPGTIGIKQVAHDYLGIFGYLDSKDIYYGGSEVCEVDINCSTNEDYLLSSRSVCRLMINGMELCSGVMVNNCREPKAYVLTANHCITTSSDALNTVFVFDYSSPWCDGPDQYNMLSLSGATLKATNSDIDFSLVELSSFPSLVYKPYLAGWDISLQAPTSTYCIHHPQGDVKKLSVDENAPGIASYPTNEFLANGFWRIFRWDMGSTEAGSSGSPLFDSSNRVRGTLTGGTANCTLPTNDYYARISSMFSVSAVASANLKSWLDPYSSGITSLNGRDPYEYNLSSADTLSNLTEADTTYDEYSSGYGYSTGVNSDSLIYYAEYFPYSSSGEIAWIHMQVAASSYLTSKDSVRIYVWEGGSEPGKIIASRKMKINESKNGFDLEVNFGSTIAVTGPFYVGYREYYNNPLSSSQPQFAIYHSQPYADNSMNTAWFNDGTSWKEFTEHPSYPMAVSLNISAIIVGNSILNAICDEQDEFSRIKVYPNPFTDGLSFELSDEMELCRLSIYDNTGNVLFERSFSGAFPGTLPINLPNLVPGIYHYVISDDRLKYAGTIVKAAEE